MTIEDLKKLDKQIRLISDPFGRGFQTLQRTMGEWAEKYGTPITNMGDQYIAWKWRK